MSGTGNSTVASVPFEDVLEKERQALGITESDKTLGVALSGGGIRSASFGLGVLQALMAHHILHRADYLSTVSGGGYIGSALTWFRKHHPGKQGRFFDETDPFGKKDSDPSGKPNFISYLRQHGNYLFPGSGLNPISTVAVLIRSLIVSVLVYFAILLTAMTALIAASQFQPVDRAVDRVLQIADPMIDQFLSIQDGPDEQIGSNGSVQKPAWHRHALFRFFKVWLFVLPILALVSAVLFYVALVFIRLSSRFETTGYELRLMLQKIEGTFMALFIAAAVLTAVPIVDATVSGGIELLGVVGYVSGVWAATAKMRSFLGKTHLFKKTWLGNALFRAGGMVFIFSLLVVAYHVSINAIKVRPYIEATTEGHPLLIFIMVALGAAVAGVLINMNDSTLGSYYRDRLMETFLPGDSAISENRWEKAVSADKTLLETMCREDEGKGKTEDKIRRPYHLINTNIILSRATRKKYKNRRGDSFLLSPLFCGSEATGYRETSRFMKSEDNPTAGMTLATAMSTSGAALNPHAGQSGTGPTCDRFVSFIMAFFNLRLGFWATNPDKGAPKQTPNLIVPGLCSLFACVGHSEHDMFIELSDGGHFENLGIYELIRRRVDTIIVSDGSADKDFTFGDLANAVERVRADFGAYIRFRPEQEELGRMLPSSHKNDTFSDKFDLAEKSYACGTIEYPETGQHRAKRGRIYLIKSTLLSDLPADLYGYRARHTSFPDQTTGDQFFDENQFDAYRELGYRAAVPLSAMLAEEEKDNWFKTKKRAAANSY